MKTKKILSLALALVLVLALVPAAAAADETITFSGGTGAAGDPYIITTAAQLADLAISLDDGNNWDNPYRHGHYMLGNDLNLSDYGSGYNGGEGWLPINMFRGVFDGAGHTIAGLYINRAEDNQGLFGIVNSGTVKNLGVTGADITGDTYVGGVAGGANYTANIISCFSTGTVKGSGRVGGVVGASLSGGGTVVIESCYSSASVSGDVYVGGVLGTAQPSKEASITVKDCFSEGEVSGQGEYTGGVVGGAYVFTGGLFSLTGSYSSGDVDGGDRTGGVIGGAGNAGEGVSAIADCYSTGNVSGGVGVGGVAGNIGCNPPVTEGCIVTFVNNYATGAVRGGEYAGGVVGVVAANGNVIEVTGNAALNPIVHTTGERVGRVVGYNFDNGGTLSGNRAWSGMTTDGGTAFSGANTHDGIDGEDFSSNDPADLDKDSTPAEAPNLDTASGWAQTGIQEAYEKGFIPLDIQDNYQSIITRAEFCRMAVMWLEYRLGKNIDAIVEEYGVPERMELTFTDTDDANILAAYRLGVTSGTDKPGIFNPNGQFTRQEAATMIMNTCRVAGFDVANPPTADFEDMDSVAIWAQPGVNFVKDNGIMAGDGTNFNPAETYSRQHSIVTFNNIK